MGQRRIKRKSRTVPLSPEAMAQLDQQMRRFREKFGREPGPDDSVFFDPDAAEPKPLDRDRVEAQLTVAMARAGIDPAIIYASRRTGLIVTTENWSRLSEEDQRSWEEALAEYDSRMKGEVS